jgi:hypothetical protein
MNAADSSRMSVPATTLHGVPSEKTALFHFGHVLKSQHTNHIQGRYFYDILQLIITNTH